MALLDFNRPSFFFHHPGPRVSPRSLKSSDGRALEETLREAEGEELFSARRVIETIHFVIFGLLRKQMCPFVGLQISSTSVLF